MSRKRDKQLKAALQQHSAQATPGAIPRAIAPPQDRVVFSFKYLDLLNGKFTFQKCSDVSGYFGTFIGRLQSICGLTVKQFTHPHGNPDSLRSHPIDFGKDTRLSENGFPFHADLWKDQSWQFELTSNKYGRIHGFWAGNIFFVVWFDPDHLLYKRTK